MKFLKTVYRKAILPASLVFSLVMLLILLIQYSNNSDNKAFILFGLIYVCLLVIFVSSLIYRTRLNTALKVIVHYVITAGSVTLYFVLFSKLGGQIQENRIFTLFLITTVIYFVIAIPILIVKSKKNKFKNEEEKYDSQFGR